MLGFTNKIQANSLLVYYLLMENSKRKRGISLSHHFIHNDNPNIVQSRVRRVDLLKSPITTSNPINLRPKSLHKPHVTFAFASPSPQNSQPRWSYQPSSQRTSINTSHNKNFSIQDNTLDTSSPFSSVLNETRERYNHSEIKKVFFGEKLMKVYPVNEIKKEQVDKRQNKIGEILTSKQAKISNYSEKKPQRLQIYNKIVDLPIQRQQQSNNFSNIHLDKIIQANQIKKNSQASKRFKRSQDLMTLKQMQKKLKQIISVCNKH